MSLLEMIAYAFIAFVLVFALTIAVNAFMVDFGLDDVDLGKHVPVWRRP